MEQGVIAWSDDGRCLLFNARVWSMLEIDGTFLSHTTTRADFRARTLARGDITQDNLDQIERMTASAQPYAFDRTLPSGRVVLTTGRPMRDGGTVVTLTDVTDARRAQADLARAKLAAEDAERRTRDILAQERTRQAEARRLAELNEWLQSCKSLDELYMVVERFMPLLLPGAKGELYIYSNSRDALDGQVKWNTAHLHPTIAADSCWALRRGHSYQHRDGGLCLPCDHVTAHGHTSRLREYICVPIVAHGDTVGLLHIRFDPDSDHGIDALEEFAMRCGEQISMAIANAKLRDELRDQSIRDPLTGLYNRRYFLDALRRQVSVSGRRGTDFGLVSLDVDHFKTFNDNHGHDAGDAALRAIGTWLSDALGSGEIPCRYGGEEFVVLAPDAGADQVQALAERIRDGIAGLRVTYLRETLPRVTVSCGVASFPANGLATGQLLREADSALYAAKGAGRNAVRIAVPRAPPP
ncbi:MAG: diguanylate cyclase [Rubellimicrobium sp.]|nr:diguanylate cyclase [Rubellimicrobium sp.]